MDYANIILEMLDRIKKLETEVDSLKQRLDNDAAKSAESDNLQRSAAMMHSPAAMANKRDTTRYMFEGNVYLKNRLVLAIVQRYVQEHPGVTRNGLKQAFAKSLQGSIGVVEDVEIASLRRDCEVRFFTKESEIIRLCDGDMYVCNQWGVLNIPNFIKAAEQNGYNIESI